MKQITAEHVTPENFKMFGKVIAVPKDSKPDAQSEIQTYYGQLAIMKCTGSIQLGICVAKKRENIVDEMEQHVRTHELLAALRGDFLVPVASSVIMDGKAVPDIEHAIAVRVNQGEGILFDTGIWHWTPYPVGEECEILVGFKTDTPKDDFISSKMKEKLVII